MLPEKVTNERSALGENDLSDSDALPLISSLRSQARTSMFRVDVTSRLPVELVSRVLDYLDLQEMSSVFAVSSRWRRIAIEHPTYWRDIRLLSLENSAINFFLTRLRRTRSRVISVELNVREPCARLSDEVLPALGEHIAQVRYLWLGVHEEQAFNFCSLISRPAPRLQGFDGAVRLSEEATGCPTLPVNLFQNNAPKLETFGLRNVDLPHDPPLALRTVSRVLFGYRYNEADFSFMSSIYTTFPQMKELVLHSGSLVMPVDNIKSDTHTECRIERLECFVHPCSREDVLARFPCDDIPVVRVCHPSSRTIRKLLGMLPRGPLYLTLAEDDDQPATLFNISIVSPIWIPTFERIFAQAPDAFKGGIDDMPHDLFRRADFVERLTSLTITGTIWPLLARLLLPLPQLTELTVRVDRSLSRAAVLAHGGVIVCPRLRELCVKSELDTIFVKSSLLESFVFSCLNDVSLPLSLRTVGTILEGSLGASFKLVM